MTFFFFLVSVTEANLDFLVSVTEANTDDVGDFFRRPAYFSDSSNDLMRRALDGVQRENKFILTRLLLLQVELTKREIFLSQYVFIIVN